MKDPELLVERRHHNTLYLLAAVCTIFMTLAVAVQPLFLRNVLNLSFEYAGLINANIQVVTEILDLGLIMYLGYLSDRFGRVPIATVGFVVAAFGALLAVYSAELGILLGVGGIAFYYFSRIIMSLGTGAVWPQISTIAGDYTDYASRPRFLANTVFMMALGATLVYAVLMQIPKHSGLSSVMVMTAVVALIGAWLTRHFMIDVAPKLREKGVPWRRIQQLVMKEERVRLSFAAAFFARSDMVFIGLFLMMWFIYFADLVAINQEEAAAHAGLLIGLTGFTILISIPFWAKFIEKRGRVMTISLGMMLSGIGFLLMGFIVNPFEWAILVPIALIATGQAACLIAPQVLVIDYSPREIRGSVLGAFNVVGVLGIIFFVQVGGWLFDSVGPHAPFLLIGTGNLILTCYALWVLRGTIKARSNPTEPVDVVDVLKDIESL
ncbi:magnetosome biogenesis transporter MamH [Magnetovibrio blakemorei]|uniref:Magnetosome protein MamH n=2 Tax=Pseudomonadota TaxID=1224 RepID=C4RAF1_9PROT|nr:magnetosome biogenesis transporter MamH [Magnetovibrio blakemorei]ASN76809.1 MamH1 [Vibrio sp. MV-1]CAV30796.1 Magnetosome protein MamH [Magnetovibrio blakemorei]